MAEYVETYRGIVYPWHCDHMGHMNVQHYVGMFDQAVGHLMFALGFTRQSDQAAQRGFADRKQILEYRKELPVGSLVRIESGVLELGNTSMRYLSRMLDVETGDVAATCESVTVYFDLEARKAVPIPDDLRAGIRERIVIGLDD
jgi:acyl-CoA thioester hydrolase